MGRVMMIMIVIMAMPVIMPGPICVIMTMALGMCVLVLI